MATMSAAPTSATTLTPPSSSHGNHDPWTYVVGTFEPTKRSLAHSAKANNPLDMPSLQGLRSNAPDLSPPYDPDDDDDENTPKGFNHKRRPTENGEGVVDENSKWIHRDKLARIETEELQAAGISLAKAIPRPRKDRSVDRLPGAGRRAGESPERVLSQIARPKTRSCRDSISSFDPERMAELANITGDGGQGSLRGGGVANGSVKSRIPIPKFAPASVSLENSDNDPEPVPETRIRSKSTGANSPGTPPHASVKRNAAAAAADASPRKGSSTRKPPTKTNSAATNRPKTRGVADSRSAGASASAANRPTTRPGELSPPSSLSKRPEGEPPWMISAYKPDPRLPPDQQLLPTVARRLQQEKWEKEGKFGNIYDKEFRPLTDKGYLEPPEQSAQAKSPTQPADDAPQADWPLKQDVTRSPTLNRGSSYSTMPKIQDAPTGTPLGSPKSPNTGKLHRQISHASANQQIVRLPEEPEPSMDTQANEKSKGGCRLCCIVM